MTTTVNKPIVVDVYFARGASDPFIFRLPDGLGGYIVFDSSVKCQFTAGGAVLFTLAVGSGISIGSVFGATSGATNTVLSILPSDTQSLLIPADGSCQYECWMTISTKNKRLVRGVARVDGGNLNGLIAP